MAKAKKSAKRKVSHKAKRVRTTRVERVAKKVVKQAVRQATKTARQAGRIAQQATKMAVKAAAQAVPPRVAKDVRRQVVSTVNQALAPAGLQLVATGNKRLVGEISHFFDKISVAVIEVKDTLNEGDAITIEGPQTNLKQKVASMQIEHDKIKSARKGQSIGMKVSGSVRRKDLVYKAL